MSNLCHNLGKHYFLFRWINGGIERLSKAQGPQLVNDSWVGIQLCCTLKTQSPSPMKHCFCVQSMVISAAEVGKMNKWQEVTV